MHVCRLFVYPEMIQNLVDFHSIVTYTIVAISAGLNIHFVYAYFHFYYKSTLYQPELCGYKLLWLAFRFCSWLAFLTK